MKSGLDSQEEKKEDESLGFGFVCFEDSESAMRAVEQMNGFGGDGSKDSGLYVRRALKKKQRLEEIKRSTEKFKRSMHKFNLYFKNFPPDTTESELRDYFSKFGEIKSLKIMRSKVLEGALPSNGGDDSRPVSPPEGRQGFNEQANAFGDSLGFGFVCFATAEATAKAKLESKALPFRDRILYVNQFESKSVRQAHLAETRDKKQLELYKNSLKENPEIPPLNSESSA